MKVVLLTDMKGLGVQGDVCTVKDGYAMNFLIPNKKAAECSGADAVQAMQKQTAAKERKEQGRERAAAIIPSLPDTITVRAAANEGGTLFSSVTKDVIAATLRDDGFDIDDAWLSCEPIKEVGSHRAVIEQDDTKKEVTIVVEAT